MSNDNDMPLAMQSRTPREETQIAIQTEGGIASVVAREEAEMKASMVLAKQFRRNEEEAYERILRALSRPQMADDATYRFPRGGSQISGPSIYLAREMARIWGNIRYGLRLVTETAEQIHIKGYAFDCETNTLVEMEDKFSKMIQRKNREKGITEWVVPDERDARELMNRRGAICVRNALLQLMPSDLVADALDQAEATLSKSAEEINQKDPTQLVKFTIKAFTGIGVTVDQIEKYLGHPMKTLQVAEYTKLRGIYSAIRDGQAKIAEYFDLGASAAGDADGKNRIDQLKDKLKNGQTKQQAGASDPGVSGPSAVAPPPVPEQVREPVAGSAQASEMSAGQLRDKISPMLFEAFKVGRTLREKLDVFLFGAKGYKSATVEDLNLGLRGLEAYLAAYHNQQFTRPETVPALEEIVKDIMANL